MTQAQPRIRRRPRCHPVKLDWNENRLIDLYRDLPAEEQYRIVDAAWQAWQTGSAAGKLAREAPKRKRKARKATRAGNNVIELFPRGEP